MINILCVQKGRGGDCLDINSRFNEYILWPPDDFAVYVKHRSSLNICNIQFSYRLLLPSNVPACISNSLQHIGLIGLLLSNNQVNYLRYFLI